VILFHIKKRYLPLWSFEVVHAGYSGGSSRILEAVEEKRKWDAWMGDFTTVSGLVGDLPVKGSGPTYLKYTNHEPFFCRNAILRSFPVSYLASFLPFYSIQYARIQ